MSASDLYAKRETHVGEAERLLLLADEVGARTVEGAHAIAAQAQVQATLALVEQQRIANLIAYWQMHTPRTLEDSYVDQLEVKVLYHDDGVTNVDVEVRKALGLG